MSEKYTRPILYLCDPNKNTRCGKSSCQWACRMTAEKEYSVDGRPLTDEEAIKIQEEAEAEHERRDSVILSFSDFQDLCMYHSTHMIDYDEQESICEKPDRIPEGESCADCCAFVCPYTEWNNKPEEEA